MGTVTRLWPNVTRSPTCPVCNQPKDAETRRHPLCASCVKRIMAMAPDMRASFVRVVDRREALARMRIMPVSASRELLGAALVKVLSRQFGRLSPPPHGGTL